MKNLKCIESVHEVDDLDYTPPSFEEVHGICEEQMEFECLPRRLQEMINTVGHGSDVAEGLIGSHRSNVSNAMRVLMREIEVEQLQEEKAVRDMAARKGPDAAGKKRSQSAKEFWKPYQETYRQLLDGGMKPGDARMHVDDKIRDDGSWPPDYLKNRKQQSTEPSKNVLEKWLR